MNQGQDADVLCTTAAISEEETKLQWQVPGVVPEATSNEFPEYYYS